MKKIINRIFVFVLTAILFSMSSSTCLAATKEATKEATKGATNIFPRTLLTLNLEKWNDGVKFKVRYVVDDANAKIIEVKSAYVSNWHENVVQVGKTEVYLHPRGTYATVKCNYQLKGSNKTYTSILKIYP
ncbi:MAG TPA: hypothetical protein DC053_08860 [Lachnoclostridium sp.]|nr:hypothetical protein [Lachnoclostridium sp.]